MLNQTKTKAKTERNAKVKGKKYYGKEGEKIDMVRKKPCSKNDTFLMDFTACSA